MSFSSISRLPILQTKTTPPPKTCPVSKSLQKKKVLRIREDIPTTPIELHVQSAGVSEEEQIFNTEDDDEAEEQILQRKKEARNHPTNQLPNNSFEKFTTQKPIITNFLLSPKGPMVRHGRNFYQAVFLRNGIY